MKDILKYKSHLFAVVLLLLGVSVQAENNIQKLTGEFISRFENCDEDHPVEYAFDGDTDTYYHSCPGSTSGDWIGLDLGKKHIITSFAYAPRIDNGYGGRIQLGIIEGANEADFGDAIALSIISGVSEPDLTIKDVNCSRGFRYVRFVFPTAQEQGKSSYMSELKFFGYEGGGDDSLLPQLTNLPTVSIHTVDAEDIVIKEKYIKGIVSIVYANGTKFFTDSLEIRGRGNNSWSHPKKPYRIKLNKSVRLMELPAKAKNWTLINNYGDKTLMRNLLAFDFSRRLEMPYTSPSEAVDVVLNGDYKGCYQLCDHIDVRKGRVDIEEMKAADLTGGYLVEIDAYAYDEQKMFVSSGFEIPVTIKYPDEKDITVKQEKYIQNHFNKLMNAVKQSGTKNATNDFRNYMDVDTFLRHFLVGEYAGNTDTYWSVRMSKKKDDDKFNFGPVWDLDLGFENDHRTYPINDKQDWICFYKGGYSGGVWQQGSSAAGETSAFVQKVLSFNDIENHLKKIYSHYRDKNIISKEVLTQVVDSCAEMLQKSQELNFKRWPIMNEYVHENPVIHGSYEAEVDNVRNYVSKRIEWMDRKLNYVPSSNSSSLVTAFNGRIWTSEETIHVEVSEDYMLKIIDLMGCTIKTQSSVSENCSFKVDKGVYVVTLINEAGDTQNIKCFVP